jgi:2-desacetyl-2-hydroxyethyl bacteriochlorophyllide A dehydrogenase
MTAVVRVRVPEPGRLSVEEVELPPAPPAMVRLELLDAGICGTDLSVIAGTTSLARYPLTLGHELAGRVVSAPAESALRPGDAAVVYPTFSCGACAACWTGRENQCPHMRVMGISDPAGCFAHVVDVPVSHAIPVEEEIATGHGSLVEPLAVACHVLRRVGLEDGDRVLIVGAGVIGLSCAAAARAAGAGSIVLVDRLDRGAAAAALGFPACVQVETAADLAEVAAAGSVDVVLDTATTQETVAAGVAALARGGRLATVATPKLEHAVTLDYRAVYERELVVTAARNYVRADFARALGLLRRGAVDLRSLVTARFPLAEAAAAVEALRARPQEHLKVQLVP